MIALTRAEVILALDDVTAGAACFGVPLQDGHGIVEVSPGVLADGQLERPVSAMLERQAAVIRSVARYIVGYVPDPGDAPETPAEQADRRRERAAEVLARGPSMMGHRVANDDERAWHREALARVGVRFKAEIRRRLDAETDVDLADAVAADDLADVDQSQATERGELAEQARRIVARTAELDALRRAVWVNADRACVREVIRTNTVKSWSRVGRVAIRMGLESKLGESGTAWVQRLADALGIPAMVTDVDLEDAS